MRKRMLAACLAWMVLSGARAEDFRPPVTSLDLEAGDAVVFLGDSITHQCLYTQYVEDFFFTRFPGKRISFHNAGVSGDRCGDALLRFDEDVAKKKPKYVTILLGMNDGSYRPFDQPIFNAYERDMTALLDRIHAAGATAVLMTPTMFDARAARMRGNGDENRNLYYNSVLAYYGALLRELATTRGLGFVDMYGPLNHWTMKQRGKDPKFTLIADAVHPDAPGQVVMAAAILDDLGVRRWVSDVQVDLAESGFPRIQIRGGKPIMVESDGKRVSFAFKADALPWVLPAEAAPGYKLTRAGHRLGREGLRVTGLPAGNYRLSIDNAVVGEYGHVQLGRGIELEENAKTPQYQQALEVARLNQERNRAAVAPMRNLWLTRKQQRVLKGALENNPDDENTKSKLDEVSARLDGFEETLARLEAKSKELLDQIYEANQPREHRYDLVPTGVGK